MPLELAVLAAILDLDADAYAVTIRSAVERRLDRAVARGALYTTLARLEDKGWVRSRLGDPLPVRGGRARRYYTVSPHGHTALRAAVEQSRRAWRGLGPLLDPA